MAQPSTQRFDVVPTHLAIKAMRESGYKNAAYAVAELIDNSIQAGATVVELLCAEQEDKLQVRSRRRIDQIAILDNGCGMTNDTLRIALQFGNGTRLDDRSGIGRFGMGLPNSSVSQCRRVEVWTWQGSPEKALYTYLDIDEVVAGDMTEVPQPEIKSIPRLWKRAGKTFGNSGTLVVWSKLDKCQWRTAKAIIDNSEYLIGRMYRRFIHSGKSQIRLAAFLSSTPEQAQERLAEANDPLYLMTPSSCPPPYKTEPMFEPYGDHWEYVQRINYNGANHDVVVRLTTAKESARQQDQAGRKPYGQHARKNIGVSIMRAGRELELSRSWDVEYDPRERWWGAEIEFPPALDELFGVANNKQSARYLSDAGTLDIDKLLEDHNNSMSSLKDALEEDGDPLFHLIELSQYLHKNLGQIREHIKAQSRGFRSDGRRRHQDPDSPEARGTTVIKKRQEDGHRGESDADEFLPVELRHQAIKDELVDKGVPLAIADQLAASTTEVGLKYVFAEAALETSAFFSVKPKGGTIIITLNTSHPAHRHLIEVLESEVLEGDTDELKERLVNAWRGLKLLLEAWARYEDEQPTPPLRQRVQDSRVDWGRVAREFLEES